jgi:hypothetical protein
MTFEIYSLMRDEDGVRRMQEASLSEGPVGFKQTHGLIGSPEWWERVGTPELPLQTVWGQVAAFWPGHHDDFAEFELREGSGASSLWPCNLPAAQARARFTIGCRVEVAYVTQEYKVPFGKHSTAKVVTSIREA